MRMAVAIAGGYGIRPHGQGAAFRRRGGFNMRPPPAAHGTHKTRSPRIHCIDNV